MRLGKILRMLDSPRATVALFAAFVASRLALLLVSVEPASDADWYFHRAVEIAAGLGYQAHGQPTAYWPVGYSATLGAALALFGPSLVVAQLLNVVFATLSALLVYRCVFGATARRDIANAAVLVLLCYPNHAAYVPLTMTESLYTCLILLACYLVVFRSGWLWHGLLGVTLGWAILTKPQTLLLIPVVAGVLWIRSSEWPRVGGQVLSGIGLCVALAAATVAPWTLRNLNVLGEFVLVSTNGGNSFAGGNTPGANGTFEAWQPWENQCDQDVLSEVEYDRCEKALATDWVRHNPWKFVALVPKKLWWQWVPDGEAEWSYELASPSYPKHRTAFRTVRWINQFVYMLIMLAYAAVVWRSAQKWTKPNAIELFTHGFVLVVSATAILFYGYSRYHYPVMPFLVMTCAVGYVRSGLSQH